MRKPEWLQKTEVIFGTEGAEKVAEYCRENWPEDTAHVMRAAEDACENTFLFDFRWDMERTWKPVHFTDEIDWNLSPGGIRSSCGSSTGTGSCSVSPRLTG